MWFLLKGVGPLRWVPNLSEDDCSSELNIHMSKVVINDVLSVYIQLIIHIVKTQVAN